MFQVMSSLETSMMQQLAENVKMNNFFGVGFKSSEAWDIMQNKVCFASTLHACNGYFVGACSVWQRIEQRLLFAGAGIWESKN